MKKTPVFRASSFAVLSLLLLGVAVVSAQSGPKEITACEHRVLEILEHQKENPPPKSFGFPNYPEIEFENSLITFRICKVKKDLTPEQEERRKKSWKCCDPEFYDVQLLKLDAFMRLCREVPVLNEIGFREVRFTIERWELFGRADLFDGDIVFSVTPGVIQPKSLIFSTRSGVPEGCQALEGGISDSEQCEDFKSPRTMTKFSQSDYPAMIIYNAIYDVWLNNKKLVSAEPGIAMARGITEIPPTGVTVAFQKPLETTLPDGTIIKICPGTCSGMVTIPKHEFWAGIETADAIKSGEKRLPRDWQPEAVRRPPAEQRPPRGASESDPESR